MLIAGSVLLRVPDSLFLVHKFIFDIYDFLISFYQPLNIIASLDGQQCHPGKEILTLCQIYTRD
jgi:hypothetical protein